MILQNWWYTTLLGDNLPIQPPLRGEMQADVAIVGGGMAGLCAALRLMDSGRSVVLLERNICGGSSTGKSAGFLTPDSELEMYQLVRRYGAEGARQLWAVPVRGIGLISDTVKRHGIPCDFLKQDSLFLANDAGGWDEVCAEGAAHRKLGYPCSTLPAGTLGTVIGTDAYRGGVGYSETHGLCALRFAQGVKRVLLEHGVKVCESTDVRALDDHTLHTHLGSVTAGQIIFCADKLKPGLTEFSRNIYHAQTFLAVSEPLPDRDVARLFPKQPVQCWDSDLVYSYFRLTGDQRLLLGGGSALTTFALHSVRSPRVISGVIERFKRKFPFLKDLEFIQDWPGLIDTTRDLIPTIVKDPQRPWAHFVLGCVGLPWAAFCGDFVARHLDEGAVTPDCDYYRYFAPTRHFFLPLGLERFVGKPFTFAVNNAWAKYHQVDQFGPEAP